jgi:hypothetical protein
MRSRWKRIVANCVLLGVSLLFAAGAAEVGVRVAAPQQLISLRPDLWQPADTVGWLRRPNISGEINTGERTVQLITDADGFRIGEHGRRTGIPVLVLGDSFMEALQVSHEQSLAGLLESTVSRAIGQPVAMRNAGMGGWSPTQYLARARSVLPHEDYRLVITAIYVGNDAPEERRDYVAPREAAPRHSFRWPRALSKREFVEAALRPLNDALEVRSHLFMMLRNELEVVRMKTGTSPNAFPSEFLKSEANDPRWTIAADICAEISELARQHGAQSLFVLVPSDFQVDPAHFYEQVRGFGIDTATVDLDQPSRRFKEELTRRRLTVIDVLSDFRGRHEAGARLYGEVDKHLSPEGHQALADILSPVVVQMLTSAQ